MNFTSEDLLESMGLKIGEKIKLHNHKEVYTIEKNSDGIVILHFEGYLDMSLSSLINKKFDIIEETIWTLDTIKPGDSMFCFKTDMTLVEMIYLRTPWDDSLVKYGMTFTSEQHAQEYSEKLKKFNEDYTRNIGMM